MEADLVLLPPRRKAHPQTVKFGKDYALHTNLYDVNLKQSLDLEQYTIESEPVIEDEGISLFRRVLSTQQKQLLQQIGLVTFKGRMMWGSKRVEQPFAFKVVKNEAMHIYFDYEILIKHTRSITYNDILLLKEAEQKQILHVYNIALK